jgi:predicted dehydrogenase
MSGSGSRGAVRRVLLVGEAERAEREAAYADISGIQLTAGDVGVVDVFTRDPDLPPAVAGALADGKTVFMHAPRAAWRSALLSLHREHGGRLRLARPARFDPRIESMLAGADRPEMGEVITVRAIRLAAAGANLDALEWWALDVLVTLGGAVERVFCQRSALRGEAEDQVLSVVRFANGAIGYAEASAAYPPAGERTLVEVVTEQGMLEYDSATSPNRLLGERLQVLEETYVESPLRRMLGAFVESLDDGVGVREAAAEERLLELAVAAAAKTPDGAEAVTL